MPSFELSQTEFKALASIANARTENARWLLDNTHLGWGQCTRKKMALKLVRQSKKVGWLTDADCRHPSIRGVPSSACHKTVSICSHSAYGVVP